MTPETCVEKGARLLDELVPGWYEKVGEVKIASPGECIFGHLYGSYAEGIEALGMTQSEAFSHGFNFDYRRNLDPSSLDECWREALLSRKMALVA